MFDDKPAQSWEVWFAWFPVQITIVDTLAEIHDEIAIEYHREWCWLRCVARQPATKIAIRTRSGFRTLAHWAGWRMYNYGPATNALIQPPWGQFYGKF